MLAAGDVLLTADTPEESGSGRHARVIISDPNEDPDNLVLVPISTWENGCDDECILEVAAFGGIPFFKRWSYPVYRRASMMSQSSLLAAIRKKTAKRLGSLPADALQRIRRGASETPFLPYKCANILTRQKLI